MSTFNRILKKKLTLASFQKCLKEDRQIAYLGVNITLARKTRGYTQAELGDMAGIPQQHVSMIENGHNVEVSTLIKVCAAMGLKHIPIVK